MTNNEKLTLARSALENLAYRGEDFDAQYTALDTLKKIDAIATESAPAAGAASIDTPEFRKLADVLAPLPEDRKDRTRAILLNYGFTIKPGETDLKPYVYAAAQALIDDALAQRAAGETNSPHDICRASERQLRDTILTLQEQLAARAVGGVDVSGLTRYGWTEAYIGDTSELVEAPNGTYVKFDDVRALLAAAPAAPVANPFDAEWLKFTATRMRVVLSHLGLSDPFPDNDKALCEVIGTVLGNVRMELQKPAPVGDGDERTLATEFTRWKSLALMAQQAMKKQIAPEWECNSSHPALCKAIEAIDAALTQQKGN